jgi:hypothetical protein
MFWVPAGRCIQFQMMRSAQSIWIEEENNRRVCCRRFLASKVRRKSITVAPPPVRSMTCMAILWKNGPPLGTYVISRKLFRFK